MGALEPPQTPRWWKSPASSKSTRPNERVVASKASGRPEIGQRSARDRPETGQRSARENRRRERSALSHARSRTRGSQWPGLGSWGWLGFGPWERREGRQEVDGASPLR